MKTICATMFIAAAVQHVKIADLSMHKSSLSLSSDAPGESMMDTLGDYEQPSGKENGHFPVFSADEERTLSRDSTAAFAGECLDVRPNVKT
jgi:proteasome activator subunit 4